MSVDLKYVGIDIQVDDPLTVAETALDYLTTTFPEFDPLDGSMEVAMLDAVAPTATDLQQMTKDTGDAIFEGILNNLGVTRSPGAPATGVVRVNFSAPQTLTIPAGTQFGDPTTGLIIETLADVPISAVTHIDLNVQTTTVGAAGNLLASGTLLDIFDTIPNSTSALTVGALTGGTEPETDQQFLARGAQYQRRANSALVLPDHFEAFCLGDPRCPRANAIDNYQPGGTPGSDIGHITVACYGDGAALSTPVLDELAAAMQVISSSAVTVHTVGATIITQPMSISVEGMAGFSTPEVQAAVQAAIAARYNTDKMPFGRDILITEIIEIAGSVSEVDFVNAVTVPSGNVTVGEDSIGVAGVVTVTVT